MLAFVVLYNLNNINITERQRELATLKVLGFFDMEVSQYVLRENILQMCIRASPRAVALPPGAAQRSRTFSPGVTGRQEAGVMALGSCR